MTGFKLRLNLKDWRTELVSYTPEEGATDIDIVIPAKVSYICDGAFKDCAEIRSVTMSDRVTYIGRSVFENCGKLSQIKLSRRLKSINEYAFSGCALREIDIPESVIAIKKGAFNHCPFLERVKLPEGLMKLGGGAFSHCISLLEIEIPPTVTELRSECFLQCTALSRVKLHEGLESVEKRTFYGCSSLERLDFPDSVLYWGNSVFCSCEKLRYVDFGSCRLPDMSVLGDVFGRDKIPSMQAMFAYDLAITDWTDPIEKLWGSYTPYIAAGFMEMSLKGREFSEDIALCFYHYIVHRLDRMEFLMARNVNVLKFCTSRGLLSSEYTDRLLENEKLLANVEAKAMLLEYKSTLGFEEMDYQL